MSRTNELVKAWTEVTEALPSMPHLSGHISLSMFWNTDDPAGLLTYSASFAPTDNITPRYFIGYYPVSTRGRSPVEALRLLAVRMQQFQPRDVTMTPRVERRDGKEWWIYDIPWVRALGRIIRPSQP